MLATQYLKWLLKVKYGCEMVAKWLLTASRFQLSTACHEGDMNTIESTERVAERRSCYDEGEGVDNQFSWILL